METTTTLAKSMNISTFDVFSQDVDDVITVLNYYILSGETKQKEETKSSHNDGFWDF